MEGRTRRTRRGGIEFPVPWDSFSRLFVRDVSLDSLQLGGDQSGDQSGERGELVHPRLPEFGEDRV